MNNSMQNFIANSSQSECELQIKKVTRTIIILITLNICPVYAGTGHTFSNDTFRFWVRDLFYFGYIAEVNRKK